MLTSNWKKWLRGMLDVTPIPTLTYTATYFERFNNASWNFGEMAPILYGVLGDYFGDTRIVYAVTIIDILGLIWIRQEDAAPPMFVALILSAIFLNTPGAIPDEFRWFLALCIYLVMGGIIYVLWKGRRTS